MNQIFISINLAIRESGKIKWYEIWAEYLLKDFSQNGLKSM